MASETPVHGLDIQEEGQDYYQTWLELLELVDEGVAVIGSESEIEAAGERADGQVLGIEENGNSIYVADGSMTTVGGGGTASDPIEDEHVETLNIHGSVQAHEQDTIPFEDGADFNGEDVEGISTLSAEEGTIESLEGDSAEFDRIEAETLILPTE